MDDIDNKINQALLAEENKKLAVIYEPFLDEFVKDIDIQPINPNSLKKNPTVEEMKAACRSLLSEQLYNDKERLKSLDGFDLILKNLYRVPHAQLDENEFASAVPKMMEAILAWLSENEETLITSIKQASENLSKGKIQTETDIEPEAPISEMEIHELFSQSPPFMEIMGISPSTFAAMYEIGCQLFDENKIDEAASVFETLSLLNLPCHEVWFSLGLCYQRLNDISKAVANYHLAILTNAWNVQTYINLAFCHASYHNDEEARSLLDLGESVVKGMEGDENEINIKLAALQGAREMLEKGSMNQGE